MLLRIKRESIAAEGIGHAALQAALVFLACRIAPWPGFTPFSIAALAAALLGGGQVVVCCAALVAGCLIPGGSALSLAGAAAVVAAEFALEYRSSRIDRSGLLSFLAGAFALLTGLISAGGDWEASLWAAGFAVAAWASVSCAASALRLERGAILGAIIVSGLTALYPALGACAAAVLAVSAAGSGVAAAWLSAGVLLGGGGGEMVLLPAALSAIGAAVKDGKWWRAAWLGGAALALSLCSPLYPPLAVLPLAGAVGGALLPEALALFLRGWMGAEAERGFDGESFARDMRRDVGEKVNALAKAFYALAEGSACVVCEEDAVESLRARLCGDCPGCPGGEEAQTRFLWQLTALSAATGEVPDARGECLRAGEMEARAGEVIRGQFAAREMERRQTARIDLAASQFDRAARLLEQLRPAESALLTGRTGSRVRRELARLGVDAGDVIQAGGRYSVRLRRGEWDEDSAEAAAAGLSRALSGRFAPDGAARGETMAFLREENLGVRTGSFALSAREGQVSGDSRMIRRLPDGRVLLAISDGMGTGEAAAEESARALELVWLLLSAGGSEAEALDAANAMLLSRRDDDMFATMDLCLLDLAGAEAVFTKLAASRSLLIRGGRAIRIDGGNLPLGVAEGVRAFTRRSRIREGDVILMGSDGVMDPGSYRVERDALLMGGADPARMAEEAVRRAQSRRQGDADDMTCLCAVIESRA